MKREIIKTADGSTTIYLPQWQENYHSKHGAIQEAYHVFVKHGLHLFRTKPHLNILEIGFGTGLNCLITYAENLSLTQKITYHGIEAYPVLEAEVGKMNYTDLIDIPFGEIVFKELHDSPWEVDYQLSKNENFILKKRQLFFNQVNDLNTFDLIYFDAFGFRVQPELWTTSIFKSMYDALRKNGVLVTYSAKGSVRRAMIEVGFNVEKLPGPPGKREMLRAIKTIN